MTLGYPPNDGKDLSEVSAVSFSFPRKDNQSVVESPKARALWNAQQNLCLTRQVSQEFPEKENTSSEKCGRKSPIRCVSEFDKIASLSKCPSENEPKVGLEELIQPNPLHVPSILALHTESLRLEADLHPMRLILSRLMAHPTLNRKGIFNSPVDPVTLCLPDYFKVITKPMDLGTIKVKLHAVAYHSTRNVVDDVRLVFSNAMTYNPPHNAVHALARDMLAFFEDQLQAFVPELAARSCGNKSASDCGSSRSCEPECPASPSSTSTIMSDNLALETSPSSQRSLYPPLFEGAEYSSLTVHTLATRNSLLGDLSKSQMVTSRKRRKRGSRVNVGHSCQWCEGRTCSICHQGCLHLEPTLLICAGSNCAGARIRKGSTYFIAPDGSRQYCQRCYTGLPPVLPSSGTDEVCRYKRDLYKRKNDEELVETWLTCTRCHSGQHQFCAMYNQYAHDKDYLCPDCVVKDEKEATSPSCDAAAAFFVSETRMDGMYTFIAGEVAPVKMLDLVSTSPSKTSLRFTADTLPETEVSAFIQRKVRDCMASDESPNIERTVLVRTISDCDRHFKIPKVICKHFRMATKNNDNRIVPPPTRVNYRSKAITLFQKVDGLDVCIFCMYVHEYDGDDDYDEEEQILLESRTKRVYIAYLDSVEHFRPRQCRSKVFHEVLVSYLATARKRGYEAAHIWACPPSRGNSFVFWNHPASQRTPSKERLEAWYHGALSRAVECGVVTDVKSLYETNFEDFEESGEGLPPICPPLLDGDFWVEEAVRIHGANFTRFQRSGITSSEASPFSAAGFCPAVELSAMLRDKIISQPSAEPFRRPVNAAAMNLKDYHKIISKPMDLSTTYARCVLGEYKSLRELVEDVQLIFNNARRYNPEGHFVHVRAIELEELFMAELNRVVGLWPGGIKHEENVPSWLSFAEASLSLDTSLHHSLGDGNQHYRQRSGECDGCMSVTSEASEYSTNADLRAGGPGAVEHRMVGSDRWLLDKRNPTPPKGSALCKKGVGRRRKGSAVATEEPPAKRRRQSWLGEEVGLSVRRMRTSFFACSLVGSNEESDAFEKYVEFFDPSSCSGTVTSRIADTRHGLLEFSQFRNLEFDTLRRAKYSTAVILFHLHHNDAPGVLPTCANCKNCIEEVRWHKLNRVIERRQRTVVRQSVAARKQNQVEPFEPAELCGACYSKNHPNDENYIPLQVSSKQQQ